MAEMINITPSADMPPVSTTTTGTTSSATTSGITPSEPATTAAGLEQEALKAQAGATEQAGEQIPVVEGQKAAGAEEQSQLLTQQAAEAERVRENYLQRIEYAQTQAARARQQFDAFQFHNYWGSLSTGQQIQTQIAAGLGGFSQGINGGANPVLTALTDAANRDFEAQKAQLAKREKSADWAEKGVIDLYGQMQHDLAALEVKHGLALKAVADKAQAALIRAGIPAAQAANDATVQGLMAGAYAKDLAAKQRYEQHFDRQQTQKAEQQTTTATAAKMQLFDFEGKPLGTMSGTPEEAAKVRTGIATAQQARALVEKLAASYSKGVSTDSDTFRERQQAQAELATILPQLKGLNRPPSHQELELLQKMTGGGIDSVFGSNTGAGTAKRLADSISATIASELSSHGIKPTPDIVARAIGGPLSAGPGNAATEPPKFEPQDKAAIRDKIRRTNQYIRDNPGADDVAEARKSVARLHMELGAP